MGGPSPQQTAQQSMQDTSQQYTQNFNQEAAYNQKIRLQQQQAAFALLQNLLGPKNAETETANAVPSAKAPQATQASNVDAGATMNQPPPPVPQANAFPLMGKQLSGSPSLKA